MFNNSLTHYTIFIASQFTFQFEFIIKKTWHKKCCLIIMIKKKLLPYAFLKDSLLFFILLGFTTHSTASSYQSLIEIEKTARQYIIERIDTTQDFEIDIHPLDRRLKLAKCTVPLEAYSQKKQLSSGALSIGIRCKGKQSWSLYNPAKISLFFKVLTLTHDIKRHTVIQASDVQLERRVKRLSQGFFTHYAQIEGKISTRNLQSGTALRESHLFTPQLIKKGDKVRIIAESSAFTIQMSGYALMGGHLGNQIRVRNSRTNKVIEGTIKKRGVVSVN